MARLKKTSVVFGCHRRRVDSIAALDALNTGMRTVEGRLQDDESKPQPNKSGAHHETQPLPHCRTSHRPGSGPPSPGA